MAGSRRKPKVKHTKAIARVAVDMVINEAVPSCEALFAAAEAIQQLIAEHCPIARTDKAK